MNGCNACLKMKPDKFFIIKDKFSCNKNKDTFNLKRFAIMQNNKRASSFYIGNLLFLILVLLLYTPACVSSKVYEWRDTKGTEHYSDKLHPEAKIVDIKPGYSFFTVKKVYDGDTITIISKLPYKDSALYKFSVRLNGIDCPEIKGETLKEKQCAQLARDELSKLILNKHVVLKDLKTEKYGRILAEVYLDDLHLNQYMIDKKLAVKYDGGTKTKAF